ncbi:MAG: hypothetical protein WDO15_09720 [Bacteroidota bacterium]
MIRIIILRILWVLPFRKVQDPTICIAKSIQGTSIISRCKREPGSTRKLLGRNLHTKPETYGLQFVAVINDVKLGYVFELPGPCDVESKFQ